MTQLHTTTTKRPIWPPPIPTHAPSGQATTKVPTTKFPTTKFPTTKVPTTTTHAPAYDEHAGNYCGSKNGNQDQERIVGGHDASLNEWPWIVALFNNGRQFCGGKHFSFIFLSINSTFLIANAHIFRFSFFSTGSLIDQNHILTAAHCVAQ